MSEEEVVQGLDAVESTDTSFEDAVSQEAAAEEELAADAAVEDAVEAAAAEEAAVAEEAAAEDVAEAAVAEEAAAEEIEHIAESDSE